MARKGKKAAKKAAGANPLADPVLKARFADELTRFDNARTGEMVGWDEMYEALDAILYSDPPLYLAGSFKSARAFLSHYLPGVTEETARSNIRVARSFDPDDEKQYGVSKLGLLLDYLEASGGAPLEPGIKINPDRSIVHVRTAKTTRKARFKDLSYDQLRAAVRAARGSKSASHSTDPPAVKTIRAALRKAHLGQVGVRLHGEKVDLTGVPLADLPSLARALRTIRIK